MQKASSWLYPQNVLPFTHQEATAQPNIVEWGIRKISGPLRMSVPFTTLALGVIKFVGIPNSAEPYAQAGFIVAGIGCVILVKVLTPSSREKEEAKLRDAALKLEKRIGKFWRRKAQGEIEKALEDLQHLKGAEITQFSKEIQGDFKKRRDQIVELEKELSKELKQKKREQEAQTS